jgi:hypothetical protein
MTIIADMGDLLMLKQMLVDRKYTLTYHQPPKNASAAARNQRAEAAARLERLLDGMSIELTHAALPPT